MNHTQGKLQFAHRKNQEGHSTELFDETGETVAVAAWYPIKTETGYATNREENARCLVACWNALLPFTTEQVENGIDLAKLEADAKHFEEQTNKLKAENERLRKAAEETVAFLLQNAYPEDLTVIKNLRAELNKEG